MMHNNEKENSKNGSTEFFFFFYIYSSFLFCLFFIPAFEKLQTPTLMCASMSEYKE